MGQIYLQKLVYLFSCAADEDVLLGNILFNV